MSWVTDPELFLHGKGGDVYLWRCNKMSSGVVPMVHNDFKNEGKVTNYLDLVGNIFPWKKSHYQELIDYISPKRLLVNIQGLVIVEIYKSGQDGKINEKELPIYIRSLDVISMSPYDLTERSIPSRTVRYLGDENGRAAPLTSISTSPNEEKLQNELNKEKGDNQALKKKVTELQDEIKTLKNKGQGTDDSHEAWMNGNTGSDWVSAEALHEFKRDGALLTVMEPRTSFTKEDDTTNVKADYFYKVKFDFFSIPMKAVLIQELAPNQEKAKFSRTWVTFKTEGKIYVCRNLTAADRDLKG